MQCHTLQYFVWFCGIALMNLLFKIGFSNKRSLPLTKALCNKSNMSATATAEASWELLCIILHLPHCMLYEKNFVSVLYLDWFAGLKARSWSCSQDIWSSNPGLAILCILHKLDVPVWHVNGKTCHLVLHYAYATCIRDHGLSFVVLLVIPIVWIINETHRLD